MKKRYYLLFLLALTSLLRVSAQCINMTNLHSSNITCTYGNVSNPYANVGVIDNGASSATSRHTIHTSIIERDYTIPYLYTVPRGETSSIRLGNWRTGSEAESITFEYTVPADNPLLLLKYAGVMENPGHDAEEQPRLKLDVMDEQGNLIDSVCNCFDFIAASNLGWNSYYGVLWKDWTNIGVNLISYIGRTVRVRLTSYDCSQSGHFGYAYIHLSCVQQEITTTACGDDVVLDAPLGYDYRWYTITGGVEKVVGTNRELIVPRDGTLYYCDCSQVGKPLCFFTISKNAEADPRYPIADFSIYQKLGCADTLYITNTSGVSSNGTDKNIPIEPCDSAVWILDDGRQFNQYDISSIPIVFANTGQHSITLLSFLTKGKCYSSKTMTVNVHGSTDPHSSYITAETCEGAYYYYEGQKLTKDSTYKFTYPTTYNCDSTVYLRLIVRPQYLVTDTIYLCDGESMDYHGQRITSNGTFYARYTTIHGCDSIFKAIVYRKKSYYIEKDTSICSTDIYNFGGRLLQKPGIYWDSARTEYGCDSITKLTLHVNPSYVMPMYAEICHGQTYLFRGKELDAPGIYYDTLLTRMGCDSVFKLVLNRNPIYLIQDTATICEGSYFNFRGRNITEEGTYYDSLKTKACGCDSVYQLLLKVNPISLQRIDTFLCGGVYDFRGRPITQSGKYTDIVKTASGCDSIFELNIQIYETYNKITYIEQCEGDVFEFRGKLIDKQGIYYDSLLTHEGCDSLYTLVYTIAPNYLFEEEVSVCSNKAYNWRNGKKLTIPGVYYDSLLTNKSRCDSVYKLTLHHLPSYDFHPDDTVRVCANEAFFQGQKITKSGHYVDSYLTTSCGCDSVYSVDMIVYDTFYVEEYRKICDHEPYYYRGRMITESGIYTDSLTTIHGCDSVYRLIAEVTHTLRDTLIDTVCVGDEYWFAGIPYTKEGFYSDTLSDPEGKLCFIHYLDLGTKAPDSITNIQVGITCADAQEYEIIVHYDGARPYFYSIYYDMAVQDKNFVNVINAPFSDTIYAPIPQYTNKDYLRPDYYHARIELQNGFCDPSRNTTSYDILVRYPSWVIRQHWNDVVAVLNDNYNGGYIFTNYAWEVNGRMLNTTDEKYSNLHMPELRFGDFVCAYLTREGETYAIPTCPIEIQDMTQRMENDYPVVVYPTSSNQIHPYVNIAAKDNVAYHVYDIYGHSICHGEVETGSTQQVMLPTISGIYLVRIDNSDLVFKVLMQ